MLTGLYSAATAMDAAQKSHEVIATDLAHVGVPGYRGTTVTFKNFEEEYKATMGEGAAQGHGVVIDELHTNFSSGPIQQTGRKLDVAIAGNGFFELSGDNGQTYTRNGVFFLSSEGVMVNSNGEKVMGENGEIRIPAPYGESAIEISTEGQVSTAGTIHGKLKIVEFADTSQLVRASTTSFRAPAGVVPEASTSRIHQGGREQSNVSPVEQLVQLIVNMRQQEAAKQSITKLDESIGRLTSLQS